MHTPSALGQRRHRIEGIRAVRAVFSKYSSECASFSPPLVAVSKRKSLIVHIHAHLAAARHSPNKQVCRSLRLPCTNVRIVLKREGSVLLRNRAALLSQAGARNCFFWDQRQSSDSHNLVSQRGVRKFSSCQKSVVCLYSVFKIVKTTNVSTKKHNIMRKSLLVLMKISIFAYIL